MKKFRMTKNRLLTNMTNRFKFSSILLLLMPALGISQDPIRIVGSSTVFPFSTVVAETFGAFSSFKTPVVESTGTGGGFKIFCKKDVSPSIVNASRRIVLSEMKNCSEKGIQLVEFMFGRDGIVLVNSREAMPLHLSEELIFAALAEDNGFGKKPDTWASAAKLVKSEFPLPNIPIRVFGPPPTSGTRDSFIELVMEKGAKKLSQQFGWDEETYKIKSHRIREDGVFILSGENDNFNVLKVIGDPRYVAIMGFSFLDNNRHNIQGAFINGVEPTFENIASGDYTVARPLFFYIKKNYLRNIAGIKGYIDEFISRKAIGEEGYLIDKGLIPLTEAEFEIQFERLKSLPVLTKGDL